VAEEGEDCGEIDNLEFSPPRPLALLRRSSSFVAGSLY
jgi:hypothetical protein